MSIRTPRRTLRRTLSLVAAALVATTTIAIAGNTVPAGAASIQCGTTGTASGSVCTYPSGTTDTYTVPTGVTQIAIAAAGGSGGSGVGGHSSGGAGGSNTAVIAVTPGQVFEVKVGTQGTQLSSSEGSGGGYTAVEAGACVTGSSCTIADAVVVAGGGGGGAACTPISQAYGHCHAGSGGAGSGASANPGQSNPPCSSGGGPGTLTGPGGGGGGNGSTDQYGNSINGVSGSAGNGGAGGGNAFTQTGDVSGGDGGAGYYGGGGGGGSTSNTSCDPSGGGGGSGYSEPTALSVTPGTGTNSGPGTLAITAITGTATSTALTSSANPSAVPAALTYTATVNPSSATGTVQFGEQGQVIPTCASQPVNPSTGQATCQVNYQTVATHAIVVSFQPTSTDSFLYSNASLSQGLTPAPSTATSLSAAPNPTTVRQNVTYRSTTTPVPDGGTVAFADNGGPIAGCTARSVNTTTGVASCTTSYADTSPHSITAAYQGTASYPNSSSAALSEVITPSPATHTALSSSPNPGDTNQAVTYTATVSPTPDAGTVAFTDGGTAIAGCTAQNVDTANGEATCTQTYTSGGSHSVVASYAGDPNYPASTSTTLTQTVNTLQATVSLSSSAPSSGLTQAVTYSLTVSPVAPAATTPTGAIDFRDGSSTAGSCGAVALTNGTSTCTIIYTTPGTRTISASYSGDANYPAKQSQPITQTVNNSLPDYTTPGKYLLTVQPGWTQLSFNLAGAQGGQGARFNVGYGGAGGNTSATLAVTSGEQLELVVGAAGTGTSAGAGTGGQSSDVRVGSCAATLSCDDTTRVLVAGGGGGGGACSVFSGPRCSAGTGGAGSGAQANAGASTGVCAQGGGGASATAPGAGGAGNGSQDQYGNSLHGASGSGSSGGSGGAASGFGGQDVPGGDGGSGYFGGGGGGASTNLTSCDAAGGGGGSGYVTASALHSSIATGTQDGNGFVSSAVVTTLSLSSTASTSTYGHSVPVEAQVTPDTATGAVQFSVDGTPVGNPVPVANGKADYSITGLAAGIDTVTASYSGGFAPSSATLTGGLTVSKATLTVAPDATSSVYGQSAPAFADAVTGYQYSDTAGSMTTAPSCSAPATTTAVGNYTISCTAGTAANYTFDTSATATYSVTPATLTVAPANQTSVYGHAAPAFTASITGFQYADDASSLTSQPTCAPPTPSTDVAGYTISCSPGSAANYTFDTSATATYTVTPATLTVVPEPETSVYGNRTTGDVVSLTGFQYNQDARALSTQPTCAPPASSTAVGNYTITCTPGTAANYTFDTSATATYTVTPATLTVSPDHQTSVYGQPVPPFTDTITGFQYGEDSPVLGIQPTCTPPNPSTAVGNYTITCTPGTAANYTFDTSATATYSVTKATLFVTPDHQTKVYGQSDPAFTYSVTGYQYGEGSSGLATQPSCSTIAAHPVDVGSYAIHCTGGTAVDYAFNTQATSQLSITPATLSVTPDNQSKVFATSDPLFSYSITGYQHGDDSTALSAQPSCAPTGSHVDVGRYTIACAPGTAGNYLFDTSATSTLAVTPAPLEVTVTGRGVLGGTPNFSYAQPSDLPSGVTSVTGTLAGCVSSKTQSTTPGVYGSTISSCTGLSVNGPQRGNYVIAYGSGAFTLTASRPYWQVAADGGVFSFGDAGFYGSAGNIHRNQPVVGMASTADSKGYWLVAADGGIFAYGDAGFYGSAGNIHLNQPVVGMAATPDGKGYWLVASDGGLFAYGDAAFYGSTGDIHLNAPIVTTLATPDGQGYWLVASDGGVFTYGDAAFYGAPVGHLTSPVVSAQASSDGHGYWLIASNGSTYTFGDATSAGSPTGPLNAPIVGSAVPHTR